ncbi:hypothetical protein MMC25_000424 [Agyrium rufum]|nr:hypothetical protein [Agyrium rufum]
MEDEGTQLSTQLIPQQRRPGQNASITTEDESDIICILHPSSSAACKIVEHLAHVCPQHVLRKGGRSPRTPGRSKTQIGEEDNDSSTEELDLADETRPENHDIALRLSSKMKNPCLGFVFGRTSDKSDVVFDNIPESKRISNMHFSIYVNQDGIIMLWDMSTNGTYVDQILLRAKTTYRTEVTQHLIQHSSSVEIPTPDPKQSIRFIVTVPKRGEVALERYQMRMADFLANIAQYERQALAMKQARKEGKDTIMPTIPINPRFDGLPARDRGRSGLPSVSLTAGSERYQHGMHWSGGDKYSVVGHIGKGAFANVYRLAENATGKTVACKELEKRKLVKENVLDLNVVHELQIMKSLKHPHIIDFIDYEDKPKHVYIIMEYVSGGDLLTYINNCGIMPERSAQLVASQMCSALEYLHSENVTHRDIKPDNILIYQNDPISVKLSDFGLSKVVKDEETFLRTFCGTLLYCAPEIYPEYDRYIQGLPRSRPRRQQKSEGNKAPYSSAVDVWSLGAVLFHLLCTKPPYIALSADKASMLENIMTKDLEFGPLHLAGVSDDGINFVAAMIQVEPSNRATVAELLTHTWIVDMHSPSQLQSNSFPRSQAQASVLSQVRQPSMKSEFDYGDDAFLDDFVDHDEAERDISTEPQTRTALDDAESFIWPQGNQQSSIPYPTGQPLQSQVEPRLFGEIDPHALKSSGVFGHDARAALDMQSQEMDLGSSSSEYLSSNRLPSYRSQGSRLSRESEAEHPTSSPSLYGAEAQIRRLNMASTADAFIPGKSYPTAPATPKTPDSQERSFDPVTASALTGSKRSPAFSGSDEATPKRVRVDGEDHRHSQLPSQDLLRQLGRRASEGKIVSSEVDHKLIAACRNLDVRGSRLPGTMSLQERKFHRPAREARNGFIERPISEKEVSSEQPSQESYGEPVQFSNTAQEDNQITPAPFHPLLHRENGSITGSNIDDTRFGGRSEPAIEDNHPTLQTEETLTDDMDTTMAQTDGTTDMPSTCPPDINTLNKYPIPQPLRMNPPPLPSSSASRHSQAHQSQRLQSQNLHHQTPISSSSPSPLALLTTTPDSCIKTTIALTSRVTNWGREPTNSHVWPDASDIRVPRAAFDIVFWRPGIEKEMALHPAKSWTGIPEVVATIVTRCSKCIWVNGKKLVWGGDSRNGSGGGGGGGAGGGADGVGTLGNHTTTGMTTWLYGVLFHGDEICVFEEGGQKICFVFECWHGRSRLRRNEEGAESKFRVIRERRGGRREKETENERTGSKGAEDGRGMKDGGVQEGKDRAKEMEGKKPNSQ